MTCMWESFHVGYYALTILTTTKWVGSHVYDKVLNDISLTFVPHARMTHARTRNEYQYNAAYIYHYFGVRFGLLYL